MGEDLRILLIEDNPGDARLVREILHEANIRSDLVWRERLSHGLEELKKHTFNLVLLDLALPDSFGIETFLSVRTASPNVPVIIMTNQDDEKLAMETVHCGAQDYLVKSDITTSGLLRRAIFYAIERNKAEEAIRSSEEKYRYLVENINEIIGKTDIEGILTFINRKGLEILEVAEEELVGKSFLNMIHPDDRERARNAFESMIRNGKDRNDIQLRFIKKLGNGSELPVIMNTSVLRDSNHKVLGVQAIALDISVIKEAERMIQNQNHQLSIINQIIRLANSSLILEEMLEIVLKITIDMLNFDIGWIFLKNSKNNTAEMVASHGVPRSFADKYRVLNMRDYPYNVIFFAGQPRIIENLPDNPPGVFDSRILENVEAICYAGVPLMTDSVVVGALFVAKHSQYRFSNIETTILESIGKEVGGTILRGMLQDQLEEAYEEANCYLDIMVHDIREVNNELLRQTQIVREMLDGPSGRFADKQLGAIQQITEIINNVTTIRKISDEQPECVPVHIDEVIRSEISKFPSATIHFTDSDIRVWADELIAEVFENLLANSVKYGGANVEIWIRVTEETGGEVTVSIEDNGPGIRNINQANIFSSFQPRSERPSGRGLGLHISKLLIDRYSGTIRADDRIKGSPGSGLAIRFTLPVYDEEE